MGTQAAVIQGNGVVVQPGEGTTFSGRGGGYTLVTKVTNDETRGAYAFQEMTVAPGFPWIPPHIHHNEDEALYGLEGEVAVRVGDQVHAVGPGTYVFMPRGGSSTPSPTRGRSRRRCSSSAPRAP